MMHTTTRSPVVAPRLERTGRQPWGGNHDGDVWMTASVDDSAHGGPGDRRERPPAPDRTSHFDGFDARTGSSSEQPEDADRHRRGRNDRGDHPTDEPGLDVGEFGADPTGRLLQRCAAAGALGPVLFAFPLVICR